MVPGQLRHAPDAAGHNTAVLPVSSCDSRCFSPTTHQGREECPGHAGHCRVLPLPHAHGDAGDVPLDLHHVVQDEVRQHHQRVLAHPCEHRPHPRASAWHPGSACQTLGVSAPGLGVPDPRRRCLHRCVGSAEEVARPEACRGLLGFMLDSLRAPSLETRCASGCATIRGPLCCQRDSPGGGQPGLCGAPIKRPA